MSKTDKALKDLKKVATFSTLSNKELQSLSRLMTQVNMKKGRVFIKQGARGSDFMIILKGNAVVRRNKRKLAELGPGDFIGELSILSGAPRMATVEAKTDMVVEVLSRREFISLLDKSPKLAKSILMGAIKRLQFLDNTKVKQVK